MAIVPNRAARNVPNGLEPVMLLEPLLEPLKDPNNPLLEPLDPPVLSFGSSCFVMVTFSVVVVVDPSG